MPQKAKTTKAKRQPFWLTHEQMAKACGISPQAFRQWGVQSVAKIGRNAFYLVADVVANRVDRYAARQAAENPPDSSEKALATQERDQKLRLTKAQAEGQELKNAQLRKELAPVAVIEWVVGKAGGEISAILDSLPSLLKKRNPKLTASNIESIRREIVKAQNAASQMTVNLDEYYERRQEAD